MHLYYVLYNLLYYLFTVTPSIHLHKFVTFLTFHIFSFSVKYLHIIQVFEVHFFIGPLNMNIQFMPQNVTEHKYMNCIHMYIVYKYRMVNTDILSTYVLRVTFSSTNEVQ